MSVFIIRRTLAMIMVLFVVSIVTFLLLRAIPGGPWDRERPLPEQVVANINARYHLDDPLLVQYADYISELVIPRVTDTDMQRTTMSDYLVNINLPDNLHLKSYVFGSKLFDITINLPWDNDTIRWMNFGPTFAARGRSVTDVLRTNFPVTLQLGVYALIVAVCIGVPAGIISALNRNTIYDYAGMSMAILGVSVPVIIMGPLLQYILGVRFNLLPISGWGTLEQMILPSFALGFSNSALMARLTRASLLQVLHEDYIRTARAKGLRRHTVVGRHAMKNAMIPVVTIMGPLAAFLLTGSFVTETIFAIPGIGREFVVSIGNRDYPLVMGTALLFAFILVLANAIVDVLYAVLDPRIRFD